jgi:hypothetical protein
LILSEKGIAILSESLTGFALCDYRSGTEMSRRLVKRDDETISFSDPYRKHKTLKVPTYRYLTNGGFRFD